MGIAADLRRHIHDARTALVVVTGLTTALCTIVMLATKVWNLPIYDFTADTNAANGTPFYTGLLSTLGLLTWAGAAAVAYTGSVIAARGGIVTRSRDPQATIVERGYLRFMAIFSLVLCLDDALMVHEVVLPTYLHLPEITAYVGYLAAAGYAAWRYADRIRASEYGILLASLGCLGISIVTDMLLPHSNPTVLLEDGSKFAGILLWLAYTIRHVAGILAPAGDPARAEDGKEHVANDVAAARPPAPGTLPATSTPPAMTVAPASGRVARPSARPAHQGQPRRPQRDRSTASPDTTR